MKLRSKFAKIRICFEMVLRMPMDNVHLFSITSSLHKEIPLSPAEEQFIKDIQAHLGGAFLDCGSDFTRYDEANRNIIYIRTGGTEGIFRSLDIKGDITLLTSGRSNSLAASMEILAWLNSQGRRGTILHGSPEEIASAIINGSAKGSVPDDDFIHPLTDIDFGGSRLGVIGSPSDWLIASDVDYAKAGELLGLEFVDIPMRELLGRLEKFDGDMRSFDGSVAIYEALKDIVREYSLSGLTIRCFDLLDTVHNTGCLALARLNAEGIPSSCEGDIPLLISMMIARRRTGSSGFQCNLSRIDGDNLLFAHCTVPLDMLDGYEYDTHFESGLGTAIRGRVKSGEAFIYRVSPKLDCEVVIPATIVSNRNEPMLCRTQIVVNAPGAARYFLNRPLANHHLIVRR